MQYVQKENDLGLEWRQKREAIFQNPRIALEGNSATAAATNTLGAGAPQGNPFGLLGSGSATPSFASASPNPFGGLAVNGMNTNINTNSSQMQANSGNMAMSTTALSFGVNTTASGAGMGGLNNAPAFQSSFGTTNAMPSAMFSTQPNSLLMNASGFDQSQPAGSLQPSFTSSQTISSNLQPDDLAKYQAPSFQLYHVPTMPPPPEMCL